MFFSQLKEEYGGLFECKEHRFTTAKAREWAVELLESGINQDQFERGRWLAIKKQKYPTERAYEFIELCTGGTVSEYPTANDAFVIACSNCGMKGDVDRKWKHGVVYETANRIGWGVLASATDYFLKSFTATYDQVCAEHASGSSFVIPKSHRVAYEHTPVQAGSAADKKINEQLAAFRRVAV